MFFFFVHDFRNNVFTRIMSDSRANLDTMIKELLVTANGLGLEPKPESPWWTSTCAQEYTRLTGTADEFPDFNMFAKVQQLGSWKRPSVQTSQKVSDENSKDGEQHL